MKYKGFTLIEILLVIVVLAVIGSLGINMYRKHAQTFRVNKTSIEIQHILEAAMSYNVHNGGVWPTEEPVAVCNGAPLPDGDSFINDYLPNGIQGAMSGLGSNFCWGNYPNTQRFWTALKVSDKILANRIKAKLPNAITTSDPTDAGNNPPVCSDTECYVRAEVTTPGATSQQTGELTVAAVGYCVPTNLPSTVLLSLPNIPSTDPSHLCNEVPPTSYPDDFAEYNLTIHCPEGKTPHVFATPHFWTGGPGVTYFVYTSSDTHCDKTTGVCIIKLGGQICTNGDSTSCSSLVKSKGGAIGATYIAVCAAS